jgi:predicted RNA methylase
MKKTDILHKALALADRMLSIDNANANIFISDYDKEYIDIRHALPYYMEIFADCIAEGLRLSDCDPAALTLVDFGGGNGFLSMLAKEIGVQRVVYVDINPLSVATIQTLKQLTGTGPDVILQGSSHTLAAWCEEQKIYPHVLIATDLIEHIYDLRRFFIDLLRANPRVQMIFTTASSPYNPFVKRRLHKLMKQCEKEYLILRYEYISNNHPELTEEEAQQWSKATRGLNYTDIDSAIKSSIYPRQTDAYNTCDPETGNWAERILPRSYYDSLLRELGYSLSLQKGFYNTHRRHPAISILGRMVNLFIHLVGPIGFFFCPFITLSCRPHLRGK